MDDRRVRVSAIAMRLAFDQGQRAKTDAVDARVLAQMGTALPLRPTEASPPTHRALEELQVARDALVKDRTAALNRQKQVRHRLLKQQNKNRLAQLDRHLAAIDTEIGKRLAEDERLARRTEILTSIPGVSRVTATGLLTQMPELGRLDAKAVASLAGLAPVTRQSGAWQGRSFIQGGRAVGRGGFSTCRHWRRSVTTRTCARSTASSSRRESPGRLLWSPSCASSSCWPTCCSERIAAGCLSGLGGAARTRRAGATWRKSRSPPQASRLTAAAEPDHCGVGETMTVLQEVNRVMPAEGRDLRWTAMAKGSRLTGVADGLVPRR